ncbi:8-oxo-dGTP diphosphatase MutT [Salinimonas chungwhensis]|uniref:8-oxo-dGTP diphosphatase MutT n=1 Tax=Salinimonas chungwhensis TaxID=265425 RepID=UPI0003652269|nr:8-oxo-dGTP diphosphatase MutT [Salinimonas chungwhensis]
MQQVDVAVGVIKRGDETFVTLRPADKHQGGKWEFPGGKKEAGESTFAALKRELLEETGITVNASEPLILIEHDYGDKLVRLDVHLVEDFAGEPYGRENQQGKWLGLNDLAQADFPAANAAIIDRLKAC